MKRMNRFAAYIFETTTDTGLNVTTSIPFASMKIFLS